MHRSNMRRDESNQMADNGGDGGDGANCITRESTNGQQKCTSAIQTRNDIRRRLRQPKNKPRIDHSIERLNRDYQSLNNIERTTQCDMVPIHSIHADRQNDTPEQEINNRIIS